MKILVVDDDPDILEVMKSFLEHQGHVVTSCSDGDAAIKAITLETFDCVFMDIVMTPKDGITALREMKKLDPSLPIVIITGFKDADRVVEAFRNGAMDVLLKPFNFSFIKENVLAMLTLRKK